MGLRDRWGRELAKIPWAAFRPLGLASVIQSMVLTDAQTQRLQACDRD